MTNRNERWRTVSGHPSYSVSDQGRVRRDTTQTSTVSGRILSPGTGRYGHQSISLNGTKYWVHRLVLEAFIGPCPNDMECRHVNGDASDNRLENLCWSTHQLNMADTIKHGTSLPGEKHPRAKLCEEDGINIRELYAIGRYTLQELANGFKLAKSHVHRIVTRLSWRHVNG